MRPLGAVALGLVALAARRPALAGPIAVAALMADLGFSNAYHVATAPQSAFEGTPRALELIQEAERAKPSPGPFRIERIGRWWPAHWSEESSRSFERITRWERDTLRPNYGMPLGVGSTSYLDTLEPMDYGLFFLPWSLSPDADTAQAHGLKPGQKVWYYPRRSYQLVFRYDPMSFRLGIVLTLVGLATLAGLSVWAIRGPALAEDAEALRPSVRAP